MKLTIEINDQTPVDDAIFEFFMVAEGIKGMSEQYFNFIGITDPMEKIGFVKTLKMQDVMPYYLKEYFDEYCKLAKIDL